MTDITNFGHCVDCTKDVELKTDGSCSVCGSNSIIKRHSITELKMNIVQDIVDRMNSLEDDDRLQIINSFCKHCGSKVIPCVCMRDE